MKDGEEVMLTLKHFEAYKKYVRKYIMELGLVGWEYGFKFEYSDCSLGSIEYYSDGRCCHFCMSTTWNIPPIDSMIERVAFHECLELLLQELKRFCFSRNFTDTDLEKEVHTVIRSLEHLFFGERELIDEDAEYKWLESKGVDMGFGLKEESIDKQDKPVVKGVD